ncbi:MAG: hypothetical protein E7649_05795 [Ruminococcaceae bacterium]|nr:hypothetical protein [Oscillospiraceae bacterium]
MKNLELLIREAMKKEGIDLIGFASKSRFEGVDPQNDPFAIFPEGKTVIMLGKRICRGSLRGVEEGTNFGDYRLFGQNWLEDEFLSLACYNLVRVLEDEGWEAVPVFPNPAEIRPSGVSVDGKRPEPNVFPDFTYAAVACGIAEIGFGGLVLTPKFGSRQRFHMIITDAELPESPLLERSVCDRCGKCADTCPLGAIDKNNTHTVDICGKKMEVADIDYDKCRVCKNGACPNRFANYAKPDRVAALCNRTCLCHLEEEGALENGFHESFRKRDAWAIGDKGNIAGRDVDSCNVLGGQFSKTAKRDH